MAGPPQIFDRKAYAGRRARAARRLGAYFLTEEAAIHIGERLGSVKRRFAKALDLSSRADGWEFLTPHAESWVRTASTGVEAGMHGHHLICDEEWLPFAPESFDLVVSILSLHAVNDLPGTLAQIRRVLKPDGLFMAALLGGETLRELRSSLAVGESAVTGGVSPHVAPFADVRDLGGLLQRAGFALPVADSERTAVCYRKFQTIVEDLRDHGETNVLVQRRQRALSRAVLAATIAEYQKHHTDEEGRLIATFDVVYLTGWAPHESQQQPLRPGSAKTRLADALGTHERKAGEPAAPPRGPRS